MLKTLKLEDDVI